MKKFIKEIIPELKKDLFKDLVKYVIVFISGLAGLWALKQLKSLNAILKENILFSWYIFIIVIFLAILISSFITHLIVNKKYLRLKHDSFRDDLTGLFNYKAFPVKLDESISHAQKNKKALSLILMDIDDFKNINTVHLMKGGDEVMMQLGAYLASDSRATDIICRQHQKGDEFVVIALETNWKQGRMAAERKRIQIGELGFQVGKSNIVNIKMSCGIAEWIPEKDTASSLIEKSNIALLRAKNGGKNRSIAFEDASD